MYEHPDYDMPEEFDPAERYDAYDEWLRETDVIDGVTDENIPATDEDTDMSDLTDTDLDALDVKQRADEIAPPAVPQHIRDEWALLDAQRWA